MGNRQMPHSILFNSVAPMAKERSSKFKNDALLLWILNAIAKAIINNENARDSVKRYPLYSCISGTKNKMIVSPNKFLHYNKVQALVPGKGQIGRISMFEVILQHIDCKKSSLLLLLKIKNRIDAHNN